MCVYLIAPTVPALQPEKLLMENKFSLTVKLISCCANFPEPLIHKF